MICFVSNKIEIFNVNVPMDMNLIAKKYLTFNL